MIDKLNDFDDWDLLPITIISVDINGLDQINCEFGFHAGDAVLVSVAKYLEVVMPKRSVISRLGSDEFALFIPECSEKLICNIESLLSKKLCLEKLGIFYSLAFGIKTLYKKEEKLIEKLIETKKIMKSHKIADNNSISYKNVDIVLQILNQKCRREKKHSRNVADLLEDFAKEMNFSDFEKNVIITAGLLHDIGKIVIEDSILNKPRKLDDKEYEEIKKHSEIGYNILKEIEEYKFISKFVLYHHERYDGKGYPCGLKKDEIPLYSRMICIADSYDAMISKRLYKKPMTKEDAIFELEKFRGSQFDPELVDVFIRVIRGRDYL